MKKRLKSRSNRHTVARFDQQLSHGNLITVFSNVAAVIIYALFLNVILNDTTGLIIFFTLAILQIILCAVMAISYNSKMWLFSALAIFLMSCIAFVYVNM